ncbi:MAG: diversity-generating retroelement protein Avd [Gammaproteobacteria bacterium]|jgi:hypothetical protein|nr:diversity-generating retroelement protein Avd [Gammaproteobacteria bacterium]
MKKGELPRAVQSCHELLLWIIPLLDQFPRNRRFTLGERLESTLLEVLEQMTEATYSSNRRKGGALQRANLRLQVARHLWRLSQELKVISLRRYEHGARLMEELGKQVGGWSRAMTSEPNK